MTAQPQKVTSTLVAATPEAATRGSRWTTGNVISLVVTHAAGLDVDLLEGDLVVVADDSPPGWVGTILEVAARHADPGASLDLVADDIAADLVDIVAAAAPGWAVDTVSYGHAMAALRLVATGGDVETTRASLAAALGNRSAGKPAVDSDATALFAARLAAARTTLEREIDARRRAEARASELTRAVAQLEQRLHGRRLTARIKAIPRSRRKKLLVAAGAALVLLASCALAAAIFDLGRVDIVQMLTLGLVAAVLVDVRRRARLLNRRTHYATSVNEQSRVKIDAIAATLGRQRDAIDASAESIRDIDQTSRRIASTLDVATRLAESTSEQVTGRLDGLTELRPLIDRHARQTIAQVDALLRIRDVVDVSGLTPALGGWAASPDVLALMVAELRTLRPAVVVECGSGASTAWLAMAAASAGLDTRIIALEHAAEFADATRRVLEDCGVSERAEVRLAPLTPLTIGPFSGLWYDRQAVADLSDVGLVFVDGPPADAGHQARFPALPALYSHLAPNATIYLDDTVRQEEREIATLWAASYPEFEHSSLAIQKGVAILRRRQPA